MHLENTPTALRNQTVLNNLPGQVYSIKANELQVFIFYDSSSSESKANEQKI